MTQNYRSLLMAIGSGLILIFLFAVPGLFFDVRWNTSPSVDGYFWYQRPVNTTFDRGDYVFIYLPAHIVERYQLKNYSGRSGRCAGIPPLLKQVVATEGDWLEIGPTGVSVNRALVSNSRPISHDATGRPLPRVVVAKFIPLQHIAVLGETVASFDSRYLGLIPVNWIEAKAERVFDD